MPFDAFNHKVKKPDQDTFWNMDDFPKYNEAIWFCLVDLIEKDMALLGRYGDAYDLKLKARLSVVDDLVSYFRRYGLIDANKEVGKLLQQLHELT